MSSRLITAAERVFPGLSGTMWSGVLAASRIVGGDVLREVTAKKE
jgi:hypothetical protein